jgi:hypothetical protein
MLARQRYLLDHALGSLARRRGRNLALLAVYTSLVFLLASVTLYASALRGEAAVLLKDAPEVTVQRLLGGRHDPMPAAYLERLQGIRGVLEVRGRLWGYYFDPVTRANYTVMVPPTAPPERGSLRAGSGVLRSGGLALGDYLSLRDARGEPMPFRIESDLRPASELLTADLLLVGEADFRRLLGVPADTYTDLTLVVRNPREVRTVAEKVVQRLPDTRPILREEIHRTYATVFAWREGLGLLLLAGAVLAFVIFAWDRAAGLSAEERREIGILKAIGWETSDVLQMKLLEGAAISVTAFLLGLGLAYAHVVQGGAPLLAAAMKGWATLYPSFRLAPAVDPLEIGTLFVLTVVPYAAATLVPTWRAAIADPDAAMRGFTG